VRRNHDPSSCIPSFTCSERCRLIGDTAIFVVEDDAANGSDHVDARRTVALVISAYCRRRSVDSSLYSTTSMLRTMELVLGLKPMSQFDAAARPMYALFQAEGDPPILIGRVSGTGDKGVLISVFVLEDGEDRIVADRLRGIFKKTRG
jgi:hypothetical protein